MSRDWVPDRYARLACAIVKVIPDLPEPHVLHACMQACRVAARARVRIGKIGSTTADYASMDAWLARENARLQTIFDGIDRMPENGAVRVEITRDDPRGRIGHLIIYDWRRAGRKKSAINSDGSWGDPTHWWLA